MSHLEAVGSDSIKKMVDEPLSNHLVEASSPTHSPAIAILNAFQARHSNDILAILRTTGVIDRVMSRAEKILIVQPTKPKDATRAAP